MWEEESDNNISDNALTLNLQAYRTDDYDGKSSTELCIDTCADDDSGSPIQKSKKRKRSEEDLFDEDSEENSVNDQDFDMPDVVHQMEAEIERQLDAKAKKTNLTVANVKNILKHVITNEQVLDLVRQTMKEPESNVCINKVFSYAPKLTRAKTKELLISFPSMAWPITPSKTVKPSKCKVLIEQEFPEDSSDEEYKPDNEEDDDDDDKNQKLVHNEDQIDSDRDALREEDEEGDDEDEDEDEDEENECESDENLQLYKSIDTCDKNRNKSIEDGDDDDDQLVICDNDNEINKEYSLFKAHLKLPVKNGSESTTNNTGKAVISNTGTQTLWPNDSQLENLVPSEENICQRTRSKFSLSDTPLETIESAFIPPDITTDMYDSECDDEDWNNFLKRFTQPMEVGTQEAADEDDEEIDPEYNIMADEEDPDDKEELRQDPGVKVSRKEVNALMAELFEYIGMLSDDEGEKRKVENTKANETLDVKNNVEDLTDIAEHIAGALEQHTVEDTTKNDSPTDEVVAFPYSNSSSSPTFHQAEASIQNTKYINSKYSSSENGDVLDSVEITRCFISHEQKLLLEQQMRQYVQLLVQHFLLTYLHPLYHAYSMDCKQNLLALKSYVNNNEYSVYNAHNLNEGINLLEKWEQLHSSEQVKNKYIEFMDQEIEMQNLMKRRKQFYRGEFPPGFQEFVCTSKVFIYPLLLPNNPFRCDAPLLTRFSKSEDYLISLGLEYFMKLGEDNPNLIGKATIQKVVPLIVQHFLPTRRFHSVYSRILESSNIKDSPIKYYLEKKCVPRTVHYVIPSLGAWKPPCEQPSDLLPKIWKVFIENR